MSKIHKIISLTTFDDNCREYLEYIMKLFAVKHKFADPVKQRTSELHGYNCFNNLSTPEVDVIGIFVYKMNLNTNLDMSRCY